MRTYYYYYDNTFENVTDINKILIQLFKLMKEEMENLNDPVTQINGTNNFHSQMPVSFDCNGCSLITS